MQQKDMLSPMRKDGPSQSVNASTSGAGSNNKKPQTDSVAQLVMSINSASASTKQTSVNGFEPNKNCANPMESDKEIEEITSRASKVHLNAMAGGTDSNTNGTRLSESDGSTHSASTHQQQQHLIGNAAVHGSGSLTMSGLISSEPVSTARQQQMLLSPSKLNLDANRRRQRHNSGSKDSLGAMTTTATKSEAELTLLAGQQTPQITLDTKVPHPAAAVTTEQLASGIAAATSASDPLSAASLFSNGGAGSCSNSTEEARYYNDQSNVDINVSTKQAAASRIDNNLASTNAGSCSGSSSISSSGCPNIINNNHSNQSASGQKPITVSGNEPIKGKGSIGSCGGGRAKLVAAKEQKLSIVVPPNSSGSFAPANSFSMTTNSNIKNNYTTTLDMSSREYCNDDFDDFYNRYDTAATEDSIGMDLRQHDPPGTMYASNNNNTTSNGDDFESPSSPKASKSAPATPCNVTPTAFHQHNSNNKSNLPNPANTLPVDTRRMLPSSRGLAHHGAQQSHTFTGPPSAHAATAAGFGGSKPLLNYGATDNNGQQQQQLVAAVSDQYLDSLMEEGESLFRHENYGGAIRNFSQCIELATRSEHFEYLKRNFRVYSRRAEGYFKLSKYQQAIEDCKTARQLNQKWAQAHYILGKAQFNLDQHVDALTTFSFGLVQVPNDKLLFEALVGAALNSTNPKLDFEDNFNRLRERDLDKDPFVVVATLGQELLSKRHHQHAAIVLEQALKLDTDIINNNNTNTNTNNTSSNGGINVNNSNGNINGNCQRRFRGDDERRFKSSVLSTTSYAFYAIGNFEKALAYMKQELEIETELNDVAAQCRVLSNIGYCYYKVRQFEKSLEAHREQLRLAIQNKLYQQAAQAFNATGHVHVARNKFTDALTSHGRCLDMLRSLGGNEFDQYKELLAMGHVHALLTDFQASEEKYKEAMQMLELSASSGSSASASFKRDEHQLGSVLIHFNLAYLALKRHSFHEATQHYDTVIQIANQMETSQKRLLYECRALNGLGHTCRVFQRFEEAKSYFARQLNQARKLQDRGILSQALCNLGMVYQHFKDYSGALALFEENMRLVENDDPLLRAYAHSYLGSARFLWREYTRAHEEYGKSLDIFKELEHCLSERKSIELNMDAVSERLSRSEMSLASNTANRTQRKIMMAG